MMCAVSSTPPQYNPGYHSHNTYCDICLYASPTAPRHTSHAMASIPTGRWPLHLYHKSAMMPSSPVPFRRRQVLPAARYPAPCPSPLAAPPPAPGRILYPASTSVSRIRLFGTPSSRTLALSLQRLLPHTRPFSCSRTVRVSLQLLSPAGPDGFPAAGRAVFITAPLPLCAHQHAHPGTPSPLLPHSEPCRTRT